MANAPGPYWVQINYHGALAPHSMQHSCKNWANGAGAGTIEVWSGGTIPAVDMIEDLVDLMLPMFNSDTVFDNFVIYRQLLSTDDPQPVASGSFTGKIGTDTSATWASAVEMIIMMRTVAFGLVKLVLLDAVSNNSFTPILVPPTAMMNLITEFTNDAKGWCGRDGAQPGNFLKTTVNINQKLRKMYRYD